MGNDGGSIPHRAEQVKTKKREERKENFEIAKSKARLCSMSKDSLREPLAVCRMGLLYNKEEVIKRLIEKTIPKAFRHIKKLKDIKEAKVQMRANNEDGTKVIVCPVSQIEFNGFHPFVIVWTCGCVISEEAAKELKLTDKCINCGADIQDKKKDIISLNQTTEEQKWFLKEFDEQQKILDEKAAKKKNDKKSLKRKEREEDQVDEDVVDRKRQKLTDSKDGSKSLIGNSDAIQSLFKQQYEENKDTDFLCRCVHRGLR